MIFPDNVPDLTREGFTRSVDHGSVNSLYYPDGTIRIQHVCARPRGRRLLIHAPSLSPGHVVVSTEPLTVLGSFLCEDCGLHGFFTDGKWTDA